MARISKPGLDYFPLDVNFLQDRKVRRISCRHHAAGIAALTSLLCLIYKEKGYYILWNKDTLFDIAQEACCGEEEMQAIIDDCLSVGLFDDLIYKEYGVLTSQAIQEQYHKIITDSRRKYKLPLEHFWIIKEESSEIEPENTDDSSANSGKDVTKPHEFATTMPQTKEETTEQEANVKTAGIIAEYNPFHNGHQYQMETVRHLTGADFVIVAMSGDFMQRGVPAIADKYTRTRMALLGGADLVLELPAVWATASAEYFAAGGVQLLGKTGVVDTLCYGCETPEKELMQAIVEVLSKNASDYQMLVSYNMKQGNPFPVARSHALCSLLPSFSSDAVMVDLVSRKM